MSVYEQRLTLLAGQVDGDRRLRLSTLFTLLQEASIAHTTLLGMGREKTLDRGLLWIVTRQELRVRRLPVYDETVLLQSWPGKTMHLLFPRYYRLTDPAGAVLAEGSALWALMERDSRALAFPEEHGVAVSGEKTGWETPLPGTPRPEPPAEPAPFTVPYSYVDLNGHMNNARYLDLAQDVMPPSLRGRSLRRVQADYSGEARLGERLTLHPGVGESAFSLQGEADGRRLFRLRLEYE